MELLSSEKEVDSAGAPMNLTMLVNDLLQTYTQQSHLPESLVFFRN